MRTIIRTVGTALVTILLSYPIWAPQWGSGILGEIWALGMPGGLAAIAVFFGSVALYCRELQRTLTLMRSGAAVATPASVWWMFAIPYNFTEDFFIVRNVSTSITNDGRLSELFCRRWTVLGYGWCAFQILSLFPGLAGYLGGAVAIPLWATHWVMTGRANRILTARSLAASTA